MSEFTKAEAEAKGWIVKVEANFLQAEKVYAVPGFTSSILSVTHTDLKQLLKLIEQRELQLGDGANGSPIKTVTYPGGQSLSDGVHEALRGQELHPQNGELPVAAAAQLAADNSVVEGQDAPPPNVAPVEVIAVDDPLAAPAETGDGSQTQTDTPSNGGSPENVEPPVVESPESQAEPVVEVPGQDGVEQTTEAAPSDPAVVEAEVVEQTQAEVQETESEQADAPVGEPEAADAPDAETVVPVDSTSTVEDTAPAPQETAPSEAPAEPAPAPDASVPDGASPEPNAT